MARHYCMVTVDSDGEWTTLTIKCDQCGESIHRFKTVHLKTLAVVLPDICEKAGIDVHDGRTESRVFDMDTPETRKEAEAMFDAFKRRSRKH